MDPLRAIEKLAQLARQEPAPASDVADRVLVRIRETPEPAVAPLWAFAIGSAAAAAAVIGLVVYSWMSWSDPLVALFSPFEMVML